MNAPRITPQPPRPPHAPILLLPASVASKIAAGEVIERPASVVRELVDNAIDAGASSVVVEIRGGGRDLIRVIDDGAGIEREEMPRAFLRHATSKITKAEDLWAITTLGFRGEALYSIAAVSRLSLLSRPRHYHAGFEMELEGGEPVKESVRGAPTGTVVSVRDLFYNLPARLKFLKSAPAEAAHISSLVQSYALAHPSVRFRVSSEGRVTFQSSGSGDLREAATGVYGADVSRQLLPVGLEPDPERPVELGENADVYGYVSPPSVSRSNRGAMHFFVNRRSVHSRMLQYAVEEAYHSLLMVGRHPLAIINVSMEPEMLDVNVHPAKAEIKFRDERAAFSAVQRAVRAALTAHVAPPKYGTRGSEGWEPMRSGSELQVGAAPRIVSPAVQRDLWTTSAESAPGDEIAPLPPPPPRNLPPLRVVGQVGTTYIIAEGPDGMYLVDQHAAHERILYERLSRDLEGGMLAVQPLMEPISLELSTRQRAEVDAILPLMSDLGFDFEAFGERTLLIRAVPSVYAASRRDLARDLLEMLDGVISGTLPERWREELLITLACHSAIRSGKTLALDEMRAMLEQLELCRYPRSCAHGRPTMLHLSQHQLEREFGRRA